MGRGMREGKGCWGIGIFLFDHKWKKLKYQWQSEERIRRNKEMQRKINERTWKIWSTYAHYLHCTHHVLLLLFNRI